MYTGLRPGEKLSEELFSEHEHPMVTEHEKIRMVKAHEEEGNDEWVIKGVDELIEIVSRGETDLALKRLQKLAGYSSPH